MSFGGAVKLTGESEYKKALKSITQSLKEVSSEMKLVTATYSTNDKSADALTAKMDTLNKRLELQKEKVETLKKQYSAMASQYDENKKKNDDLAQKYETEKKKLDEIKNSLGVTSSEYKGQAEKVAKLADEVKKSTTAQEANETALSKMRVELNNAEADLQSTTNEIKNTASAFDDLGESAERSGESAENAQGGFTVFKGALADLVSNVITNAISKMKELINTTLDVGMSFDASMSKVGAISGATSEEMEKLRAKAKEMGENTKFSANESAEALNYMAMAGWGTEDMLNGIDGVMALASASGADLATTSDIVTDALTGFGESADQAGRLADIMASASSNANTNVEMMGETFKYVTPIAGSLGYSMEDTATYIALMANSGIKASQAGTSLRSILTRLSTDAGASATELGALGTLTEKLGVEFYNADGSARDLSDVLNETRGAWKNLTAEEQTNYAKKIAGQEAMTGWLAIMNASEGDVDKLSDAINNSSGSAEKMAQVMQDNLQGEMTILKSHVEGVQISMYEKFEPALRKGVEMLNKLLDAVQFVVENSDAFIASLKIMASAIGTYLAYTTAIKVMHDGWKALTIVTKAQAVAQQVLNAVMSANPIGLVISAIVALVGAFMYFWKTSEGFRDFWIGLWEGVKEVAETVWEAIKGFFAGAWEVITDAWSGAVEFFGGIWDGIVEIFSTCAEWVNDNVIQPVMAFFQPLITFFTDLFIILAQLAIGCVNAIMAIWGVVSSWIDTNVIQPVKNFFTALWDGISKTASACWTAISTAWAVVSGWFHDHIIKPIADFFTGMWNGITKAGAQAWAGIKSVFSPVVEWFKNVFSKAWKAVKNVFSTGGKIFDGIKDGIVNAFKTVVNAIINGINKVIAVPFNAINTILGKIKNVEIAGIKPFSGLVHTFSVPQIPQLARGGIVDGATMFIAGESGKEAVIPLENNTGWIAGVAEQLARQLEKPFTNLSETLNTAQTVKTAQMDYNGIVDAFKDALSEMSITLDDAKLGYFVEKTVADAIYT